MTKRAIWYNDQGFLAVGFEKSFPSFKVVCVSSLSLSLFSFLLVLRVFAKGVCFETTTTTTVIIIISMTLLL